MIQLLLCCYAKREVKHRMNVVKGNFERSLLLVGMSGLENECELK